MTWSPLNAGKIEVAKAGVVSVTPIRKKLIIYANGPSRSAALLDDPESEVWTCNSICPRDRKGRIRADRWFEMHPLSAQTPVEMQFLRDLPVPVYMFDAYPEVPQSVRFPMEVIEERFRAKRGEPGDLFTCTFCYQISLAILEGFEQIDLCGIDLDLGTARERTVERMGVLYCFGIARAYGIRMGIPKDCTMYAHPWRYGYDYQEEAEHVEGMMEDVASLVAQGERIQIR
jgi:hypothetical protein